MLSKCTNPGCAAKFAYLHQGKLFRWDTASVVSEPSTGFGKDSETPAPPRRIEFFWLCDECAAAMTLTFDRSAGVTVHPLKRAAPGSARLTRAATN